MRPTGRQPVLLAVTRQARGKSPHTCEYPDLQPPLQPKRELAVLDVILGLVITRLTTDALR